MASESQRHNEGESQPSESTHFPSGRLKYRGAGYPPPIRPYPSYYPCARAPPPPPGPYPGYYPCARAPPPPPPPPPPGPYPMINATLHQQGCQNSKVIKFLRRHSVNNKFLVLFIFTLHIIMLLALRPELPVSQSKYQIDSSQIHSHMYNDKDYILASANSPKFAMDTVEDITNILVFNAYSDNSVESWVVDKLAKERSNEGMSFHFRMVFSTSCRLGSWLRSNPQSMKVVSEDIIIAFAGASGDGNYRSQCR
ncbi:hydroxyproline-rich glycoprotein [Salix suchowensis]|nr:hydroxyproline-rich glycoprotein [Salix suchowensis]